MNTTSVKRIASTLLPNTLLIVLVLAVFAEVREFEFIYWDDNVYVFENPYVKEGLTFESIKWAFSADLLFVSKNADYWQPLTFLSRMIDVEIFGLDPGGHHATNLILHLLNAILLFQLLRSITGQVWPAFFVAAVFGIHPLQVESVAWVTERKDVLCAFFFFLALNLYVKYARAGSIAVYLSVIALHALGLMAKPSVAILPAILLVLDYWELRRIDGRFRLTAKVLLDKVPFAILSLTSAALTSRAIAGTPPGVLTGFELMERAVIGYAEYCLRIALPQGLSPLYPPMEFPVPSNVILWTAVFYAAVSFAVYRTRAAARSIGAGLLWFVAAVLPVMLREPYPSAGLSDRFAYLGIGGFFIAVVFGLRELLISRGIWSRAVVPASAAGGAILLALALSAHAQSKYWSDSRRLFERTLEVYPNAWPIMNNLGSAILYGGDDAEAARVFKEILRQDENSLRPRARAELVQAKARAHHNLGVIFQKQSRSSAALDEFRESIRLDPSFAPPLNNLGAMYALDGDTISAYRYFRSAIERDPELFDAHFSIATILETVLGDTAAEPHYRIAMALRPDHARTAYRFGKIFFRRVQLLEAEELFRKSLAIDPSDTACRYNLGLVLASRGKVEEAASELGRVIASDTGFASAFVDLGVALALQGRISEAAVNFEKAVLLAPGNPNAHKNLAIAYSKLGRSRDAIASYRAALAVRPEFPEAANNLGWILATDKEPALRNGPEALFWAKEACRGTNHRQPEAVATLAAAYAEVGNFAEAEKYARLAIELANASRKTLLAKQVEYRLELYREGKPYHGE